MIETGFLFRGSPSLMIRDASLEIMDTIFKHDGAESQINLLRVIAGFLSCQKLKDHATDLSGPGIAHSFYSTDKII